MKLGLISLLLFAFLVLPAVAQEDSEFTLFNSKTYVKNPLDLRDPFKRSINKKRKTQTKMENYSTGIYSNVSNSLSNATIDSIKVIGIVIGPERRAMVRIDNDTGSGSVIFVKEGMRIGNDEAEVKAILPGGIVVVEKIKNVYDQDEYLETVIPVSEE